MTTSGSSMPDGPLFASEALAGKRILVTGGGSGLGRGMAEFLAAHGAEVHLWGRRGAALQETAESIGGRAHVQTVDIRDGTQVEDALDVLWREHGPLTGLINNAAANFIAPTASLSPRAFRAITSTVIDGTFNVTVGCGRRWIDGGDPGSIVSMLVSWIWTGSPFVTPSAMSKAALHAMTMSLAVEWGAHNIRVNAIAAGLFPTEYAYAILSPPEIENAAAQPESVPLQGRAGRVDELASLVMLLQSDAAAYITGATIPIDGGQHLTPASTFAGLRKVDDATWAHLKEQAKSASARSKT